MNAKVSAQPDGSGLLVEFSKDNGFAYTAAQKPEVQQLLSQTIQSIAGEAVPYRLVIAGDGGAAASVPVAPQPMPARPAVSRTIAQEAPQPAPVATQSAPVASRPAPAPSAMPSESFAPPVQKTVQASVPTSSQMQVSAPAVSQVVPEDDQVPLDVYDSMAPADDYGEDSAAAFESSPDAARFAPRTVQPVTQPQPSQPQSSAFQPGSVSSSSQPLPPQPRATAQAPDQTVRSQPQGADESGQIVEILSNTFGDGIKFEELSD